MARAAALAACGWTLLLLAAAAAAAAPDSAPGGGSSGGGGGGGGHSGHGSSGGTSKPPWNETWTDKLKTHLLDHYDKFARPAQYSNTTVVVVDMTFRHVDLDELRSIMTVHGWVKMSWIDEKLKWSESEWGGLGVLHIADHEIWQPDIVLYNSATGNTIDHYGNTHCLVYPNGEVLWVPPSQFIVFCALDLRRWPFDEQTCHLRLGSWTYDGEQVELQLGDRGAEIELMETNSEWEVVRVTERRNVKVYACCDEPYIDVTYNVTVRRRSPTYSALVLTPATVIVLMTLSVFWLPPTAGEKLLLSCTTALIICLFLLYFSQQLPAMAGHTPLIVLFYSSSLYLVCVSMMVSVVVLNLARPPGVSPPPWALRALLHGWPGCLLGLRGLAPPRTQGGLLGAAAEELREHASGGGAGVGGAGAFEDEAPPAGPSRAAAAARDWLLLATAVDRVAFLAYCLLFGVLAAVYAV
ncbi:hypothetical protein R5R35_007791 [Gryllus longicercus]|uniref:Uncharacterized protein n=1 Tax=Gryllus longicercus TaxID=2509291 RepID=A0AAN9WUA7_9ORTH